MKFLLAQFVAYAVAAFAVGVAAGVLWQRRPVRESVDRARRLERAKLSVEDRLTHAELDLERSRAEVAAAQDLSRVATNLRLELIEMSAAHQAAIAAKDASDFQLVQLRADLDRRVMPAFSSSSAAEAERRHSADVAVLRAEHRAEVQRQTADRAELVAHHSAAMAAVQEQLGSAERELQAFQRRHNEYLRITQTSLTAAIVRAERAEALLSVRPSVGDGVDAPAVIDLRLPSGAVVEPGPAA